MKKYNTTNKEIKTVMKETTELMKVNKANTDNLSKLYYLRKYNDCTAILTDKHDHYYLNCLFDVYGPYKTTKDALNMRAVVNINQRAHNQLMVSSWEGEGAGFLTAANALL